MCRWGLRVFVVLVVVGTASPAGANEPMLDADHRPGRFTVGLRGVYSWAGYDNVGNPMLLGVEASALPWRYLEVGIIVRIGGAEKVLQFDILGRVAVHWRWRWVRLLPGVTVGYNLLRHEYAGNTLVSDALLLQLNAAVAVDLPSGLELRLDPAGLGFYVSRYWSHVWEPSFALHYRF